MENRFLNKLNAQPRGAMRPEWTRAAQRHKLSIGASVTLVGRAGEIRSKDMEKELQTARFEITRLLPAEGQSFQYRIKDTVTGRERVVAEDQIKVAS